MKTIDEEILRIMEVNRIKIWERTYDELLYRPDYICLILRSQVRKFLSDNMWTFTFCMELNDFIEIFFPEFYELKEEYIKDKSEEEIANYGWFGPCNDRVSNQKRIEVVNTIIKNLTKK